MPCFSPLTAYYSKEVGESGKRGITFQRGSSHSAVPLKLPCGQCIGCRLERSRQWAMRCMHEKSLHRDNWFVTLTYSNEYLPSGATLRKRDLQLFMKRLRKEYGNGIRFYACGEYGSSTARPHYHVLLFNCDIPDRRFYGRAKRGQTLYNSETLLRLWPFGFNVIGGVDFDSCAYVARYITKKILGDAADHHYNGREPEFTVMSRRPGIGAGWFERFGSHAYEFDSVVVNGREVRPPRFYDTRFEVLDSDQMSVLKLKRRRKAIAVKADNTSERLRVKERHTELVLKSKKEVL